MKKFISFTLALMLTAGLFTGCGNKTAPVSNSVDESSSEATPVASKTDESSSEAASSGTETPEKVRTADPNKKKIVFGISAGFKDFTDFVPEMMKEWGYEVEIKAFDDPVINNTALSEGSIDANYTQHLPYLLAYNQSKGTTLYPCKPYIMSSMDAIVSKKYTTLDEVPNGASIAVADDSSNLSVNLEDLASIGWIKLKEIPEGSYYTLFDIEENVKDLKFVDVSMFARFSSLDDGVDLAMVFYSNKSQVKYKTNLLKIFDENIAYPQVIAVQEKDKDAQWVADLTAAMTSDKQVERINEKNIPDFALKILFR
ncbi:MAG: MetQ/NlpA family ABC transporter substrate-binding protein [Oscillospiraceae bacterium]